MSPRQPVRRPRAGFAFILGAAFLAAGGPAAALESFRFSGDAPFQELCNYGVSDLDCEIGVAELRAGDGRAGGGEWEAGLRVGATFAPVEPLHIDVIRQAAFDGEAALNVFAAPFALSHDGAGWVTLTVGPWDVRALYAGTAPANPVTSSARMDLAGMETMFIRSRANEGAASKAGATRLEDLTLEGPGGARHALGGLAPTGTTAEYLRLSDFDFALAWTLSGLATYEWAGVYPDRSRLSHTVKLTDWAAPPPRSGDTPPAVPLPAAGWALALGVGALAALRRRRRGA